MKNQKKRRNQTESGTNTEWGGKSNFLIIKKEQTKKNATEAQNRRHW